jgi:hypothetical protein
MVGFTQVGLLEKSQDLYARAYDIQSAKLGPEHPDVAYTMNHTAGLLKVMGKFGDAESVYRAVGILLTVVLMDLKSFVMTVLPKQTFDVAMELHGVLDGLCFKSGPL